MFKNKSPFFKGFVIYFILSVTVNLLVMILLKKQAEYLASDILHLIPSGIFNAIVEAITPMYPDILFIIPIGLTDAVIGGMISLILSTCFKNRYDNLSNVFLIISFVIFTIIDVKFIPLFTP